jgi:CRISPR/Cas system-associated exonuclease Cas4 (RecB family)
MSLLPADFRFSQRSFQDYVDCWRRFQLRYLQRLDWPAIEVEPMLEHEHRMQVGAAFHRLVQGHLLGVPSEHLSAIVDSTSSTDGQLKRWWHNYLGYAGDLTKVATPEGGILVEATLSAPLGSYRLIAKYDLIRWEENGPTSKVVIVDWKTSSRRPPREWLAERLQTRVYPFLLTQAGGTVVGIEALSPEQIEMVYWYPEYPQESHRYPYSSQQGKLDQDYLIGLVQEIENLGEGEFLLTKDESRCKYCTYRSLCDRGLSAGILEEQEEDQEAAGEVEFTLDFNQIAEIEY